MKQIRAKVVAVILAAALVAIAIFCTILNRPLIKAPKGTAKLDNKLDTTAVAHLVADEADVLPEEVEQIVSIYNANWDALDGRNLAVVTVETTDNAEKEAWQWVEQLSLGRDDALLLIETQGSRECALVANGQFRDDLATMDDGYLNRLTYMPIRAGDFDVAVLAVCERMHYFFGYDAESHRRANLVEALSALAVVGAFVLPTLIHLVGEKVDKRRFQRWYDNYGVSNPTAVPWRTVFFWHRVGSQWYEERMSGEWVDIHANILSNRSTRRANAFSRR